MPPALSVIGPKVSIERMYAADMSMPMVATAVPNTPLLKAGTPSIPASEPSMKEPTRARPMVMAVAAVVSRPAAGPVMILVAGPVGGGAAVSRAGGQGAGGGGR